MIVRNINIFVSLDIEEETVFFTRKMMSFLVSIIFKFTISIAMPSIDVQWSTLSEPFHDMYV